MATIVFATLTWRAMLDSNRETRYALDITERPHLAVDPTTMRWTHPPDTPDREITFDVHNYGRSPGRLVRFLIQAIVVRPPDKLENPRSAPAYRENEAETIGVIIVPTQKFTIQESDPILRLSDDEVRLYKEGGGWLYVYGFFDYSGLSGEDPPPYRSAFGFRYDPPNKRFVYLLNLKFWMYR